MVPLANVGAAYGVSIHAPREGSDLDKEARPGGDELSFNPRSP